MQPIIFNYLIEAIKHPGYQYILAQAITLTPSIILDNITETPSSDLAFDIRENLIVTLLRPLSHQSNWDTDEFSDHMQDIYDFCKHYQRSFNLSQEDNLGTLLNEYQSLKTH